jgi:hypothetical protein
MQHAEYAAPLTLPFVELDPPKSLKPESISTVRVVARWDYPRCLGASLREARGPTLSALEATTDPCVRRDFS